MNIFCANDIRGIYPAQVNEDFVYKVARAFVKLFNLKTAVIGHDIRLSGPELKKSMIKALTEAGCDVIDIGQCGTEMIYFATAYLRTDGGIMITASHNPKDYNGLKLVMQEARPISKANGLKDIEALCNSGDFGPAAEEPGTVKIKDIVPEYIEHLLSYIDVKNMKPLKVVANTGNGAAGPIINVLEKYLPLEFVKVFNNPDGTFPNGVPNPILTENREVTSKAVVDNKADVGIAWDGDFDRCFLFDENGDMIEGYYMVGFLAEAFLQKNKGARIIHDPRLVWNTQEICQNNAGEAVCCHSGHSFIKDKMREIDAVYGGEMSAHHYFRDFSYCDSGMIPWLLVLELLSIKGRSLSSMITDRIRKFPCSGEINVKVSNVETSKKILQIIEEKYAADGKADKLDGLSIEYPEWRFNLRMSSTEPVIRLNVESRQDEVLLKEKTDELLDIINS